MNSHIYILIAIVILAVMVFACSRKRKVEQESPIDTHNRLYKEGCDLIDPYMRLHNVKSKSVTRKRAHQDLQSGINNLKQVVEINPENWSAFWVMGKAYQALNENESACDSFAKAYSIQKEDAEVAREYMFECLSLGRSEQAVELAQSALALEPDDHGLLANLALALLIDAQVDHALATATRALDKDPSDKITSDLKRVIQEVKAGTRQQPRKFGDLQGVE